MWGLGSGKNEIRIRVSVLTDNLQRTTHRGSYCPRSGTGATQSYWRHEVVLTAEGDWRF